MFTQRRSFRVICKLWLLIVFPFVFYTPASAVGLSGMSIFVDGKILLAIEIGLTDDEVKSFDLSLNALFESGLCYQRRVDPCIHSNPDKFIVRDREDPTRAVIKGKIQILCGEFEIRVDSLKVKRMDAARWDTETINSYWMVDPDERVQLKKATRSRLRHTPKCTPKIQNLPLVERDSNTKPIVVPK